MDIFLLIGQSNMAGRGRLEEVAAIRDPRIRMFRDNEWLEAIEPLHRDNPKIAGVGLTMSFAAEVLSGRLAEEVGLLPCAQGATSLSQWARGSELYRRATDTVAAALKTPGTSLAGVLWHQGENDAGSGPEAQAYGGRLSAMVAGLRADLAAPGVPFVAGELGRFLGAREFRRHFTVINGQLNALAEKIPRFAVVSSEGLAHDGFDLHFDSRSLREFGVRYAREYTRLSRG
jgi:hypothetical protein